MKTRHHIGRERIGVFDFLREDLLSKLGLTHPRDPLWEGEFEESLVARAIPEGVILGLVSDEHAERATGNLGVDLRPLGHGLL